MELFFETYLIIALFFTILTFCIARLYLRNKKYTFGFSALMVVLGVVIPYFLILFQKVYGSLDEIERLKLGGNRTLEEIIDNLRNPIIESRPTYEVVFDYFTQNLRFIIPSIAIGITLGILVHLLLRKQKRTT